MVNQKICYLKESHFYLILLHPSVKYYILRGRECIKSGEFLFIIYYLFLLLITCYLLFISYYLSHWKSFITSGTCSGYIPFHQQLSPVCSIFTFCRQIANIFRVLNISRLCPDFNHIHQTFMISSRQGGWFLLKG